MDPKLGATKAIVANTAIGGPLGNARQIKSELFKRDRPSEEGRLSLWGGAGCWSAGEMGETGFSRVVAMLLMARCGGRTVFRRL